MKSVTQTIPLSSQQPIEIINITEAIKEFVATSDIQTGILHVGSAHTTMGVAINEECEKLRIDMLEFFKQIAPPEKAYEHNKVAVDGRPNAHSHLLSLMVPSNQSLVVKAGELQLGTWQSLFAIELDGPRPERKIQLTLLGV